MNPTRLFLVRHGATTLSAEDAFAGATDVGLSAKGAAQAEAHARKSIASQPIGDSDFAALEVLLHKGPLPVNVIGRKVLLTSGAITAAIDRLAAQGLVERRPHSTDRRARVVHLTPSGKRLITGVFAEHERDMEAAASALSPAERATVIKLLKKLGLEAERALGAATTTSPRDLPGERTC